LAAELGRGRAERGGALVGALGGAVVPERGVRLAEHPRRLARERRGPVGVEQALERLRGLVPAADAVEEEAALEEGRVGEGALGRAGGDVVEPARSLVDPAQLLEREALVIRRLGAEVVEPALRGADGGEAVGGEGPVPALERDAAEAVASVAAVRPGLGDLREVALGGVRAAGAEGGLA